MYSSNGARVQDKKEIFDFRSDTVTVPTPEMLQSVFTVEFGDDVRGEDPTVNKLQKKVAELCGKEDALFVCSGVMSNQLAIRTHVTNNYGKEVVMQEVMCDYRSHVYKYELGSIAFHSGCQVQVLHPELTGSKYVTAEMIESHLHTSNDLHTTLTTIISLENTLNGTILPLEEIKKIREVADKYKLSMHLDGARLWNACIATGIEMKEYAKYFDTISLCLSKGLGAPVGSVLVGSKYFIDRARQYRKVFGGGWRQAGILAACGLYAIEHNWPRMKEDHEHTKKLYDGVVRLGFESSEPETNMLFLNSSKLGFTFENIMEEMNKLEAGDEKTKVMIEGHGHVCRLVVHQQIPLKGIERVLELFEKSIQNLKQ